MNSNCAPGTGAICYMGRKNSTHDSNSSLKNNNWNWPYILYSESSNSQKIVSFLGILKFLRKFSEENRYTLCETPLSKTWRKITAARNSYFLHWNFDEKCWICGLFLQAKWLKWKSMYINFSSQLFSVEVVIF